QITRREIYNHLRLGFHSATWPYAYEISSVDAIKGRRISMNLCLNAFVIQFPDELLDTCSVTAPRALLLPCAHRGHCKDEDSYKECSSHVEFLHKPNYDSTKECFAYFGFYSGGGSDKKKA